MKDSQSPAACGGTPFSKGAYLNILFHDDRVCVCIKPAGVNSTDVEGGLPSMVRDTLGGNAYTVHRLDAAVSGLMVLSRTRRAASDLSEQIREHSFGKDYLDAELHRLASFIEATDSELRLATDSIEKNKKVTSALIFGAWSSLAIILI